MAPTNGSVLFVGGHADGKRATLPKLHAAIKSAVKKPITRNSTGAFEAYEIGEEIHTLRRWRSNATEHTIYVLDSMSDAEAMGRLIEHYRPNH